MDHVLSLKSLLSGREFAPDEVQYVDPAFGNEGILDVQYDYDLIKSRFSREQLAQSKDFTIWRYKPLLPVAPMRRCRRWPWVGRRYMMRRVWPPSWDCARCG